MKRRSCLLTGLVVAIFLFGGFLLIGSIAVEQTNPGAVYDLYLRIFPNENLFVPTSPPTTPSYTPTPSVTFTLTPTSVFTPTFTPTYTEITSATSTDTPTEIFTPTDTPTDTPAFTSTPSATLQPIAAFRKGPDVLFSGDNTQMKIVWQLNSSIPSTIRWGLDTGYSQGSATVTEYGTDHQYAYTITGLAPGIKYFYSVSGDSGGAIGSFLSAPDSSSTALNFFAYGDMRNGGAFHNAIAGQIISTYTADPGFQTLILSVGDLVTDGSLEANWTNDLFNPKFTNVQTALANISFLSVMGNHEGNGALFKKYLPMPFVAGRYWSFDYGPAHFVMLDQYIAYGAGSDQYVWLKNDLAASTKSWKFIVLHEPGWSAGGGHDNNPTVQNDIQPLAVQYGVSIVFGGHLHYYARAVVNGITHLTVGGGGAGLYTPDPGMPYIVTTSQSHSFVKISINGNLLAGTAVNSDGSIIETFELTR
jgi:hypothetical protein